MNTTVKKVIANLFFIVFLTIFLGLIFLSTTYANKKAIPIVVNPIQSQTAYANKSFNMTLITYDNFKDLNDKNLVVTIKQANNSDLPSWLTTERKPISPTLVGELDTYRAYGISVAEDYVYLAELSEGIKIIDVTNLSNPTLVGSLDTNYAHGISVKGNYVYIADDSEGIKIIDATNRSNPTLAGSLDTHNARGISVEGDHAYVADWTDGFKIIDIKNVSNLILVGELDTNIDYGVSVVKVGDHVYLADSLEGIEIIDVANFSNPISVGGLSTNYAYEVLVVGDHAYVAGGSGGSEGLKIINIRNSSNPTLVGQLDTYGANGVSIKGNYAYIADRAGGFKVADITNLSNPTLAGELDTYDARGVSVKGGYAYVADYEGLKIIKLGHGLILKGTPSSSDIGKLNLKAIASNGEEEIATEFYIDILEDIENKDKRFWKQFVTGTIIVIGTGIVICTTAATLVTIWLVKKHQNKLPEDEDEDNIPLKLIKW